MMSNLSEKIEHSWIELEHLDHIAVSSKQDVVKRLYGNRCPIELSGPFTKDQVPEKKFSASMCEEELEELLRYIDIQPKSCLEVGSHQGDTAILIARTLNIPVVCVDTWLGGPVLWHEAVPDNFLNMKKDEQFPITKFFTRFAANVTFSGTLDLVTCIQQPSSTALRVLAARGLQFDLIYIDGSHDYIDVYIDLVLSTKLLTKHGVLLGDDFQNSNVRAAVMDYSKEVNKKVIEVPITAFGKDRCRKYFAIKSS
ncbi:hypothetical protein PsAD26_04631 [Pseudovibrio sp. Ad26]|nr:hypothetical protein PsAD26_04631 [Pseudovibrio sp. Ad26]